MSITTNRTNHTHSKKKGTKLSKLILFVYITLLLVCVVYIALLLKFIVYLALLLKFIVYLAYDEEIRSPLGNSNYIVKGSLSFPNSRIAQSDIEVQVFKQDMCSLTPTEQIETVSKYPQEINRTKVK